MRLIALPGYGRLESYFSLLLIYTLLVKSSGTKRIRVDAFVLVPGA